ncbi:MAG TPA: chemotaxis protein CheW [Methylomirabilota bacterium]|nr:chemotaxis protein CheW [Methylomirabilota bacterium]
MGDMDDIVKDFLIESYENLDQLDRHLVALEKEPTSQELLSAIFRTIHTIKGACGFLGFAKLESVAHVGENLLSRLRDGHLLLNPEITTALLVMVDAIRQMLALIEATGQDGDGDYSALIATLTRLQAEEPAHGPADGQTEQKTKGQTPNPQTGSQEETENVGQETSTFSPAVSPSLVLRAQPQNSELSARESFGPQSLSPLSQPLESVDTRGVVADSTIRVDVGLLDKLMNLVGELVLARNQVLQFTADQKDTAFVAASQRLNLITSELQEGVMKTRMQPIGTLWSKLPRVVRDLAMACGKKVRVEMEGKETELDKTLIEAMKDPLTHMVRNAVDHGIESPEQRLAVGKPAEGVLLLKAYHEGGQVNIEISDDGGGVNFEKVKQKALERGLITQEQAGRMSDREAASLIFLPGFSTAERVTNVSGRGVGMDVVRTNIEKINGTIDLQSTSGQGSTFKIKIPLTLAIIPALTVTSGGDRYAIPQVSLVELVRLEGEEARNGVEMIHGAPVYRLRGNLLPIVYLNRLLRLEDDTTGEGAAQGVACDGAADALNIVVLHADDRQFGLVVDDINDTQEIVVKPLGKQLKGLSVFAGATVMGDGKVALILDVLGVAQRASVIAETRERSGDEKSPEAEEQNVEKQTLLLFRVGEEGRMAVPLSEVARLEEFPLAKIERSGAREVVQYRGQIMPLVRLAQTLGLASGEERDPLQVVVYSYQGRSIGLVVDRILDIVEETVIVQSRSHRAGILGSAVIQQRVMDLVDVHGVICMADPMFFAAEAA